MINLDLTSSATILPSLVMIFFFSNFPYSDWDNEKFCFHNFPNTVTSIASFGPLKQGWYPNCIEYKEKERMIPHSGVAKGRDFWVQDQGFFHQTRTCVRVSDNQSFALSYAYYSLLAS